MRRINTIRQIERQQIADRYAVGYTMADLRILHRISYATVKAIISTTDTSQRNKEQLYQIPYSANIPALEKKHGFHHDRLKQVLKTKKAYTVAGDTVYRNVNQVISLLMSGASVQEVSAALGVSRKYVNSQKRYAEKVLQLTIVDETKLLAEHEKKLNVQALIQGNIERNKKRGQSRPPFY